MPLPAILAGLSALQSAASLFKTKGKPMEMVQSALDTVHKFVGEAKEDPETAKLLSDHELAMEQEYTKQSAAALAVMNTEAGSEDAYVRRSRPTLLYVGYVVMLVQFVLFPICGLKIANYIDPTMLVQFYQLFGAAYLGYGALRTFDKHSERAAAKVVK